MRPIKEPAEVLEPIIRELGFLFPVKNEKFVPVDLVVGDQMVCPFLGLAFEPERKVVEIVFVLRPVRSFFFCDKEPDRREILGLEDPVVDGCIGDFELLFEIFPRVHAAIFEEIR